MNKQISLAILVIGIVLIVYGISASNSFSSDVSRAFTGSPTDRTMWLLGGGVVFSVLGGMGFRVDPLNSMSAASQTCRVCGISVPAGFTNCDNCYQKSDKIKEEDGKGSKPVSNSGKTKIKK